MATALKPYDAEKRVQIFEAGIFLHEEMQKILRIVGGMDMEVKDTFGIFFIERFKMSGQAAFNVF
ncbi:hypothetical protein [Desulfobotulus sp.]|uniref:hypothetical protein n=1 Tax=Desulfobotulus sp. TaxID=1940337 RepID=UPI002A36FEC9|nr:hypothetical protein [Desulfobotulus sp.]MDY0164702.1 hypothetical protein [Desulfobotulus sp.]